MSRTTAFLSPDAATSFPKNTVLKIMRNDPIGWPRQFGCERKEHHVSGAVFHVERRRVALEVLARRRREEAGTQRRRVLGNLREHARRRNQSSS